MCGRRIFINAKIVDVITGSLYRGWFSVVKEQFEYVEEGSYFGSLSGNIVDLTGQYVVPGLIDAHMHIESSLMTPRSFGAAALQQGTCAVLQDPHEMANVFGPRGVKFMIDNSVNQPLRIYTAIPSCVPPTRNNLETSNAEITAEDVADLSMLKNVKALGEVMDYKSVLADNEEIMQIISAALSAGLSIEGHCPTLTGRDLSKYIARGIRSDHTLTNPIKMREQLRKGMYVMLQSKSLSEENVAFVMGLQDRSRILLVTDDSSPVVLMEEGHLNRIVNLAISNGWEPVDAIAAATIRPAMYMGIRDMGSISPGKWACFFTTRSIEKLEHMHVFIGGIAFSPSMTTSTEGEKEFTHSLRIQRLSKANFRMINDKTTARLQVNVITVNSRNTVTDLDKEIISFTDGYPDIKNEDLVEIAVFRRKSPQPEGSKGLVRGLGIQQGAFATSFAHDSHNLLIIGKDPTAMAKAGNAVLKIGGGMVAIDGPHEVLLELPIGGLISDASPGEIAVKQKRLETLLVSMGLKHRYPLTILTVLSLTVSPYYKMSDLGLVGTESSRIIPIIAR